MDPTPAELTRIKVGDLILDPYNPRLPEELQGSDQATLFDHLYRHGALDELVESMVLNGFFHHEPLIVLPEGEGDGGEPGRHVVVEGNRRLAALMLIHGHDATGGAPTLTNISEEDRAELDEVACYIVADREAVRRFVGYRHIGGLKPWPAEAKARFIETEVETAADRGAARPFYQVGREVGSNAQGVRNQFLAIKLLRLLQEERGDYISHVLRYRFGVWLRCMTSTDIRTFINLGDVSEYYDVEQAVESVSAERLAEVISDLSPGPDGKAPVLNDSREVTVYGQVLRDDRARETLRRTDDLDLARQVLRTDTLPKRARGLLRQAELIRDEVVEAEDEVSEEVIDVLRSVVRAVRRTIAVAEAGEDV